MTTAASPTADPPTADQLTADLQSASAGPSAGRSLLRRWARAAPLTTALLALGLPSAEAKVRLGDPLPAHPWAAAGRELVVVYGSGCGDMAGLWDAALASGLPLRAVFAEGDFARTGRAPITPWRGEDATTFARQLRIGEYPAVLLVNEGRILNAWEGTFAGKLD